MKVTKIAILAASITVSVTIAQAAEVGTRKIDVVAGAFANVPPIPWH
jgi:hypothetical protein